MTAPRYDKKVLDKVTTCEVCDAPTVGLALFDVWYTFPCDVGMYVCARCASLAEGSVCLARGGVCERARPSELAELRRTFAAMEDALRACQESLASDCEQWSVTVAERIVCRLQRYREVEAWAQTGRDLRRLDLQDALAEGRRKRPRAVCRRRGAARYPNGGSR